MAARILDGKKLSEEIVARIAKRVSQSEEKPGLGVVLVGEDPASKLYVSMKNKAAERAGFKIFFRHLPEKSATEGVLAAVRELNRGESVHGVLVQLPLPKQVDRWKVLESIEPAKDVDGLTSASLGALAARQECFVPATARGVMELLGQTGISLAGANACVIGAGVQTGRPLTIMLLNENCTVTTCNVHTRDLASHCRNADLLVSAAGKAGLVRGDMVKEGAIVVDVGVSKMGERVVGDVEFESAAKKAGWITPVPGGVGPMTVAMLLQNALEAFEKKTRRK